MELKGYGQPTCNKLYAFCHDASIVVSVVNKVVEFCWQHDRLVMANFSESKVWDKVPEGITLILEIPNFLTTQCTVYKWKKASMPKTSPICLSSSFDRTPTCDKQTQTVIRRVIFSSVFFVKYNFIKILSVSHLRNFYELLASRGKKTKSVYLAAYFL